MTLLKPSRAVASTSPSSGRSPRLKARHASRNLLDGEVALHGDTAYVEAHRRPAAPRVLEDVALGVGQLDGVGVVAVPTGGQGRAGDDARLGAGDGDPLGHPVPLALESMMVALKVPEGRG